MIFIPICNIQHRFIIFFLSNLCITTTITYLQSSLLRLHHYHCPHYHYKKKGLLYISSNNILDLLHRIPDHQLVLNFFSRLQHLLNMSSSSTSDASNFIYSGNNNSSQFIGFISINVATLIPFKLFKRSNYAFDKDNSQTSSMSMIY